MSNGDFYEVNFTPIYIIVSTIAILAVVNMVATSIKNGFNMDNIISNIIGIVIGALCTLCSLYVIIKVLEKPGEYIVYFCCLLLSLSSIGNIVSVFS